MKAEINMGGDLKIIPDSETEKWALHKFVQDENKQLECSLQPRIDSHGNLLITWYVKPKQ